MMRWLPVVLASSMIAGCVSSTSASLDHRGDGPFSKEATVRCGATGWLIIKPEIQFGTATVRVLDGSGAELVERTVLSQEGRRVDGPKGFWRLQSHGSEDFSGAYGVQLEC